MTFKLEAKDNYLLVEDSTTGLTRSYPRARVRYVDFRPTLILKYIDGHADDTCYQFDELRDKDNLPWVSFDILLDFLRQNTGGGDFIPFATLPDVQDLTDTIYKIYNNFLISDIAERQNRVSSSGVTTLLDATVPTLNAALSEVTLPGFEYFLNLNKLKFTVPSQTYTLAHIGTGNRIVYYYIDSAGNLNPSLVLEERQDGVYLIRILIQGSNIIDGTLVEIWQQWTATRNERIDFVNSIFTVVNAILEPVPGALEINSEGTTLEYEGASYRTNLTSPNRITFGPLTPIVFNIFRGDGSIAVISPTSTLPLGQWDNNGVLTNTTPSKGYQVALGISQTNQFFMTYAIEEFMDLATAGIQLAGFDPNFLPEIKPILKIAYNGDILSFDDTTKFVLQPLIGVETSAAGFVVGDGTITTAKLADKAVTAPKIADSVGIWLRDIVTGNIGYPNFNATHTVAAKATTTKQITGTGEVLISDLSEIVGTGTLFTSELQLGDSIQIGGEIKTINNITDAEHLNVDSPFSGVIPALSNIFIDHGLLQLLNGAGLPKVSITRAGNVGINTDAPTDPLHVNGTARVRSIGIGEGFGGPHVCGFHDQLNAGIGLIYRTGDSSLNIEDSALGGSRKVTFLRNGNVGINKSNPSEKLEVVGNIKADNLAKLILSVNSNGTILRTITNQTGGTVAVNWDGSEYDITLTGATFLAGAAAQVTALTFTSAGAIVGHAFRESNTEYRIKLMRVSDIAFTVNYQAPFTLMIW